MDPQLSPVIVALLFAPFVAFGIGALILELSQSRRDRDAGVITSWGELRLTENFLVVGHHRNARRIPLTGLTVDVRETGSPADGAGADLIRMTVICPDGEMIEGRQLYSQGSVTAARMFEILFNRAVPATPVVEAPSLRWAA